MVQFFGTPVQEISQLCSVMSQCRYFLTRYNTIVVRLRGHACIVAKRCEIGPSLLLINNRKSHIDFQYTNCRLWRTAAYHVDTWHRRFCLLCFRCSK